MFNGTTVKAWWKKEGIPWLSNENLPPSLCMKQMSKNKKVSLYFKASLDDEMVFGMPSYFLRLNFTSDVRDIPLVCLRIVPVSTYKESRDRSNTVTMTKANWELGPKAREPYNYPSNILPFYDLKDLETSPFICVSTADDDDVGHTGVTFLATRPELIQRSVAHLTTDIGDGLIAGTGENDYRVPKNNIDFILHNRVK
jgi:hypothetical protein